MTRDGTTDMVPPDEVVSVTDASTEVSVTDTKEDGFMPRSGAEARARLREAALDLYGEQGYEATTTVQIAARAGVTERTYFRHFADKREVLFDGETELRDTMCGAVAAAPDDLSPLALVLRAYVAAVPL